MVSSTESDASSITKWYPHYSTPYFIDSCAMYPHQHLGLNYNQMV